MGDLTVKRITVWGTAFKPETGDIHDSPAFTVAQKLRELGATVTVTDPRARGAPGHPVGLPARHGRALWYARAGQVRQLSQPGVRAVRQLGVGEDRAVGCQEHNLGVDMQAAAAAGSWWRESSAAHWLWARTAKRLPPSALAAVNARSTEPERVGGERRPNICCIALRPGSVGVRELGTAEQGRHATRCARLRRGRGPGASSARRDAPGSGSAGRAGHRWASRGRRIREWSERVRPRGWGHRPRPCGP
ncbi:UDP binding domain-containing protein [Streptomyces sp. MBT62]|uniref:UDP binding domain-containing protein n=1 Tax=Streptomyces sp. MBT62 TaxID=2800410 RepID=UPI00190D720D|nr:UDP binding domain-containing protein [Streptomyces sp. MBT62]MBK3569144.1 hypothetical protein [Streptomyces sp. MBT62]